MFLPLARGLVTSLLITALRRPPDYRVAEIVPLVDGCADEDAQLALWICYELHYRGFDDAAAGWEWAPALLTVRAELEDRFTAALAATVAAPEPTGQPIAEAAIPAATNARRCCRSDVSATGSTASSAYLQQGPGPAGCPKRDPGQRGRARAGVDATARGRRPADGRTGNVRRKDADGAPRSAGRVGAAVCVPHIAGVELCHRRYSRRQRRYAFAVMPPDRPPTPLRCCARDITV